MKEQIRLYVIPLYTTKENDEYYIFNDKKDDQNKLDIFWLDTALIDLKNHYSILQTEICGGEITLVSDFYLNMLFQIIKLNCNKIFISTNFVNYNKSLINCFDTINVKFNFNGFSKHKQQVFDNIKKFNNKSINLKSLDISCDRNEKQIIEELNMSKIKSWEIIPYHHGKGIKKIQRSYSETEKVIRKYLFFTKSMRFAFQNKLQLDEILPIDNYNVKNVYITPNNKFALQNFTENDEFELLEFDNVLDLQEKIKEMENLRDKICLNCDSKLRCLANRYLNLNYKNESCSGLIDLIKYYDS